MGKVCAFVLCLYIKDGGPSHRTSSYLQPEVVQPRHRFSTSERTRHLLQVTSFEGNRTFCGLLLLHRPHALWYLGTANVMGCHRLFNKLERFNCVGGGLGSLQLPPLAALVCCEGAEGVNLLKSFQSTPEGWLPIHEWAGSVSVVEKYCLCRKEFIWRGRELERTEIRKEGNKCGVQPRWPEDRPCVDRRSEWGVLAWKETGAGGGWQDSSSTSRLSRRRAQILVLCYPRVQE